MSKMDFVKELRKTADILKPFIESYEVGSMRWKGSAYVKAETTKKPDPYALAWWSSLSAMAGLLEAQESELTEKQKNYLERELCGGMGSLSDLWLDTGQWGKPAEEANSKLDAARQRLSELLTG